MNPIRNVLAFFALAAFVSAPTIITAQSRDSQVQHRQKTKNDWRNLGYLSSAVGLFGLLKHDNTLFFAGAAGALYSANRYEQDRKSQNKTKRARAAVFGKNSFTRNGVRYVRHMTTKNGKKYYYFAKA